MEVLIAGALLFFGVHLLPTVPGWREGLIARLGRLPYLGLFSLLSALGLGLLIYGYGEAPRTALWTPPALGRPLAHALMPLVFILLASAYLSGHLREKLRHPMLIGTALWAGVHLLNNGELAAVLLFGGFLAYSLLDMALARPRSTLVPRGRPRALFDLIAVVGGLVAFVLVLKYHRLLFGVAVSG